MEKKHPPAPHEPDPADDWSARYSWSGETQAYFRDGKWVASADQVRNRNDWQSIALYLDEVWSLIESPLATMMDAQVNSEIAHRLRVYGFRDVCDDATESAVLVNLMRSRGLMVVVAYGFLDNQSACLVYEGGARSYLVRDVFLHLAHECDEQAVRDVNAQVAKTCDAPPMMIPVRTQDAKPGRAIALAFLTVARLGGWDHGRAR